MKIKLLTLLLVFTTYFSHAQHRISTGGTINTCSGTFHDSGGSAGDYQKNEDYVFTICPDAASTDDVTRITFTQMCITGNKSGCTHILYLYQGDAAYYAASGDAGVAPTNFDDSYCGTTNPTITASNDNTSGCLTFRFISGNGKAECGWSANISCVTPCINPIAALADDSPLNICPSAALNPGATTVNFDASGSSTGGYTSTAHTTTSNAAYIDIDEYVFDWGDGTTTTSTDGTETHVYATPGVYKASVKVTDDNNDFFSAGCPSTNAITKDIVVTSIPSITEPSTAAVCNGCVTLSPSAETRTVAEVPPTTETVVTPLPDGDGNSFTNSVDYGGYFPAGQLITAGCYPTVCFDLDHSYTGDLVIKLVAPDGKELLLFNRQGANTNFGACTPAADDGTAGCPRTYCFEDGGATTIPTDAGVACGGCALGELGGYAAAGTYGPFGGNFNTLIGAPMNGAWTLLITDNLNLDDGTLHGWSMSFPDACYKELNEVSPLISSVTWNSTGSFTGGSISTNSVAIDPAPGDACPSGDADNCNGTTVTTAGEVCYAAGVSGNFTYPFTTTDEYGCQYAGTASVSVTCPLADENLYLRGLSSSEGNLLKWFTNDQDMNAKHYVLERMTNSKDWSELKKISSTNADEYSFTDKSFSEGDNYYRVMCYPKNTNKPFISDVVVINNNRKANSIKSAYNVYGQEVPLSTKGLLILQYEDGTIERKYLNQD